jgi:CTP:molybdopterin cytidylyltransferase MocA
VIWLGGEPGYDQWQWVRGVMAAHKAGCCRQILVVEWGFPYPNLELGGRVEVVELDAAARKAFPGMLGSFQLGLEALGERDYGPVFLALAARPLAASSTYRALFGVLDQEEAMAVKPCMDGKFGHPVLIGEEGRLLAATLDPKVNQVRDLLLEPCSVEVEDPGVLWSIRSGVFGFRP